jgi:hypothetical protein
MKSCIPLDNFLSLFLIINNLALISCSQFQIDKVGGRAGHAGVRSRSRAAGLTEAKSRS